MEGIFTRWAHRHGSFSLSPHQHAQGALLVVAASSAEAIFFLFAFVKKKAKATPPRRASSVLPLLIKTKQQKAKSLLFTQSHTYYTHEKAKMEGTSYTFTPSSPLQQAQQLSNDAVALFKRRQYSDAICLLRHSMALGKGEIARHQNASKSSSSSPSSWRRCADSDIQCCFSNIPQDSCFQVSHPNHPGFVFSRPIEIMGNMDSDCPHCCKQVMFCVLFNIALSHHASSMYCFNNPEERRNILLTSLKLYELAFRINVGETEIGMLGMIAVLNNVSAIHNELRNEESARQARQQLLEALMMLVTYGEFDKVCQLDDVFCNVMPIVLGETRVAPAA